MSKNNSIKLGCSADEAIASLTWAKIRLGEIVFMKEGEAVKTNCINCAAPLNPKKETCEYCRTFYKLRWRNE